MRASHSVQTPQARNEEKISEGLQLKKTFLFNFVELCLLSLILQIIFLNSPSFKSFLNKGMFLET